jgi:hypothetical protein
MEEERALELLIADHSETLFKIWIIKQSHINNALYKPYISHAAKVIQLTHQTME